MRSTVLILVTSMVLVSCGSDVGTNDSNTNGATSSGSPSSVDTSGSEGGEALFPATLGRAVSGYQSLVDLAVRTASDDTSSMYAVEQGGTIRLVEAGGRPGILAADLSSLTEESGEQGLLGLAFSRDGATAYVNYTDLDGNTTVDAIPVNDDGTFAVDGRVNLYSLAQPYRNHNGGDLVVSSDGRYLLVFNGDGGSADDPERTALDPASHLGKIVRIDLESAGSDSATIWASGLRNPWRAYLDPMTDELWVADVGQNEWEEINVVPFARSQGASFGWSAYEGTVPFNEDQIERHETYDDVAPIYTYPHENDDCSISGGAVYRGDAIPVVGTWYVFSDFCSGIVRALCVTDERQSCGVVNLGRVENSVAVLPDDRGELWVLSLAGNMVPIVAAD